MTEIESDFSSLQFSTGDLPERTRIEALRDAYSQTILNCDFAPWRDNPIHFTLALSRFPGLGLAAGVCSPVVSERTSKHVLGDDLVLNVTLRGARTVRQLGREAELREGEAVISTSSDPGVVTIHAPSRFVSVRVPRLALAPLVTDLDAILVKPLAADTPAMRLLVHYVRAIQDTDLAATAQTGHTIVAHVHDLMGLALGATRDAAAIAQAGGVRAARLEAIKSHIIAHLGHADLSVTAVAARHQVSARYIQMLFEIEGTTFSEFVLSRRLARAHRLLSDPRHAARTISTLAFEAGFGDLSYFNRVFRRLYGATPSDIRHIARDAAAGAK